MFCSLVVFRRVFQGRACSHDSVSLFLGHLSNIDTFSFNFSVSFTQSYAVFLAIRASGLHIALRAPYFLPTDLEFRAQGGGSQLYIQLLATVCFPRTGGLNLLILHH